MPTTTAADAYAQLREHAREIALLNSSAALLGWDERTKLPKKAGPYRAEQMTYLAGLEHQKATDPRIGEWLDAVADDPLADDPHSDSGATIRQLRWSYDRQRRLPEELVKELARTSVLGQQAWAEAREKDDFESFAPLLEKTFQLKRQQAEALGYDECPYDALLEDYEPYAKTSEVVAVLEGLRSELVPLIESIIASGKTPNRELLTRRYPVDAQETFGRKIAAAIGFDFDAGRLDITDHPFCSGMGPHDCRITTRYDEHFFSSALFGTVHEAGHGMYEQGLREDEYGLPLGTAVSLGIHESQSRMWENLVGRSRSFWNRYYGDAQAAFPEALAEVTEDEFFFAVNDVQPSLIRVEADEATYNLHILVRFELEQALINDDLAVADLPGAWNEKYQQYLGITPPNDAEGVLQDIHWSAGLVGYFATYSLGNLYASQFFEKADAELGGLDEQFARGEFGPLLNWLRKNVHQPGQRYPAAKLVEVVTGEPLSHAPLMRHLSSKYGGLFL
ncbi:MAG: carboxypeptidase M32 [Pirellulales bacterium]|nr:carboxypeptidase M32 [Pirellulales bacterium]